MCSRPPQASVHSPTQLDLCLFYLFLFQCKNKRLLDNKYQEQRHVLLNNYDPSTLTYKNNKKKCRGQGGWAGYLCGQHGVRSTKGAGQGETKRSPIQVNPAGQHYRSASPPPRWPLIRPTDKAIAQSWVLETTCWLVPEPRLSQHASR